MILVQAGLMPPTAVGAPQHFSLPRPVTSTNFQPGELRATSSKTDVAIEGAGFFVVQMANGAQGFNRDGEFQINSQGQLTSKQGYPCWGMAGRSRLTSTIPLRFPFPQTARSARGPS